MKKFFVLIGLLLLMACSKEPAFIVQEDIEPINEASIELIEEGHDDGEQIQQLLEFSLVDQQVTLNINNIPVLFNYLKQHSEKDKAIQEMQLTQIMPNDFDSIFILSFACQDNVCSYLLINTETAESQLLADQAQVIKIEPSPNLKHLLIVFKRNLRNNPWEAHKLIVYDIDQWTNVILSTDNEELISLHSFRWPIVDTLWLNDTELEITLPDIEQPDSPQLTEWHASPEQNTKTIITELD